MPCFPDDPRNDFLVPADIVFDFHVRQFRHGYGAIELLVVVTHIDWQCVPDPRLVHDAPTAIGDLPPEGGEDLAVPGVGVYLRDEVIALGPVFLAHQVDGHPMAAQGLNHTTGPQVAPRAFEQVSMKNACCVHGPLL